MKRIFTIVAAVIVLLGLGILVYILFFANKSNTLTTVGNPFGDGSSTAAPANTADTGPQQNAGTLVAARLIKITNGPVSEGAIALDIPAVVGSTTPSTTLGTTTVIGAPIPDKPADTEVRYIERASGNVYSFLAHTRFLTRISNKTIPGIQEASFTPDGTRAYVRFLSNIGTANENVGTYALEADGSGGYALEDGLTEATVSGSSTLFTLFTGTTGSVGQIARADGSNARTLFSSVLSSLIVHPTTAGALFANTKASYAIPGYAFSINRATGEFSRILGGLRGLTVLPNPQGTSVLYSYTDQGVYHLAVYDVASHSTTMLPVSTFTEKCVWAPGGLSAYCAVPTSMNGNLPDDWYQGATSFSDRIWKIDLTSRAANFVVDPFEIGKVAIDAVALTVDPNEDVLVFTDRVTGSLWLYDL
jgi:hypothetical protein